MALQLRSFSQVQVVAMGWNIQPTIAKINFTLHLVKEEHSYVRAYKLLQTLPTEL